MNRKLSYQTIQKLGGRLGQLSSKGLSTISKFEKDISKIDKQYTGGLGGELYKISPLKTLYEANIQPVKSTLAFTRGLGTALEQKKPQYAIKASLDLFDKNDPFLKFSESENPFYRVAKSPYFNQYKL